MPKIDNTQRLEKSLNSAFATNDLHRICGAIDDAVLDSPSIIGVAQDAGIDRTTLYRAFRREKGPALNTMINVLRALGFHLIVQTNRQRAINPGNRRPRDVRALYKRGADAKATARLLTVAFKGRELHRIVEALALTLYAQENIAEVARKTIRPRETLYRSFTAPRIPRFSTVLSFLDALELQFAVKMRPPGDKSIRPGLRSRFRSQRMN